MLEGWHGSFVGRKRRKVWRKVSPCLLWTIWKEWNQRTFEGEQCTIQALEDSLITNLYMWSQGFLLGGRQEGLAYLLDFIELLGSFSYSGVVATIASLLFLICILPVYCVRHFSLTVFICLLIYILLFAYQNISLSLSLYIYIRCFSH